MDCKIFIQEGTKSIQREEKYLEEMIKVVKKIRYWRELVKSIIFISKKDVTLWRYI